MNLDDPMMLELIMNTKRKSTTQVIKDDWAVNYKSFESWLRLELLSIKHNFDSDPNQFFKYLKETIATLFEKYKHNEKVL